MGETNKTVMVNFVRNCVAAGSVWGKGDSAPIEAEEAARLVRAGDAVLVPANQAETATVPGGEVAGR